MWLCSPEEAGRRWWVLQHGCFLEVPDARAQCSAPAAPAARPGGTLRPEGLAAEVALEGLLAGVRAQVHVEVGFLREGVVAELANIGPLISVGRDNVTFISALPASAPQVSCCSSPKVLGIKLLLQPVSN